MKKFNKCIVAPDSFKGTMSAAEVCDIIRHRINYFFPECEVISLPIADGGEGTVDTFLYLNECRKVEAKVQNAHGERCRTYYAVMKDTAIIEVASAAGLAQAEGRLNPSITNTFGVGEMIKDAVERGYTKVLLGLGGSCTNDGGTGMARALGTRFYNHHKEEFDPRSDEFHEIAKIDNAKTEEFLRNVQVTAMCDITNRLYGADGAAVVFAPQKGADLKTVKILDDNLRSLSGAIQASLCKSVADIPGSGAAGGAGAGVVAFLNGKLESGIDTVLDALGFDSAIIGTDAIFTGEGRLDSQSLHGKAIAGIAKRAKAYNIPVIVIAGEVEETEEIYQLGVSSVFSINRKAEDYSISRYKSRENLTAVMDNILRLLL